MNEQPVHMPKAQDTQLALSRVYQKTPEHGLLSEPSVSPRLSSPTPSPLAESQIGEGP